MKVRHLRTECVFYQGPGVGNRSTDLRVCTGIKRNSRLRVCCSISNQASVIPPPTYVGVSIQPKGRLLERYFIFVGTPPHCVLAPTSRRGIGDTYASSSEDQASVIAPLTDVRLHLQADLTATSGNINKPLLTTVLVVSIQPNASPGGGEGNSSEPVSTPTISLWTHTKNLNTPVGNNTVQ